MKVLVTGGAGFIGSAVVRHLVAQTEHQVVNVDALTYAGNLDSIADIAGNPNYIFEKADICDATEIRRIIRAHRPDAVMHLAAESHVDRSIDGSAAFFQTNVMGTHVLLETARMFWNELDEVQKRRFRFHHISTDEVFGSLGASGAFTEETPYAPNSPYSASKASSDHLVRAWHHTYRFPTLITNCSNNYGPRQFPEKLVPLTILNALEGQKLSVYGTGQNVRDWLYVEDHVSALEGILKEGSPGETYNIGGGAEIKNIDVVHSICDLMDELAPKSYPHTDLISFVADRPGHDYRYAISADKIMRDIGWRPRESFASGLRKTVRWYLENRTWWARIRSGLYRGERLGMAAIEEL